MVCTVNWSTEQICAFDLSLFLYVLYSCALQQSVSFVCDQKKIV